MSDEDDEEARKVIAEGPLFSKAQAMLDNDDKPHTPILFPEHIRPHREPVFEAKYVGNGGAANKERKTDEQGDMETTLLKYFNWVLDQIRPIDLFGANFTTKTDRMSDEDAKILLQGSQCRSYIAFALASTSMDSNGEIRQRVAEISSIAKKLFDDAEIFKEWKDDLDRRKRRARSTHYGDYTPFNCPPGKWLDVNKSGPTASLNNAITALCHICEEEGKQFKFDLWSRRIKIVNLDVVGKSPLDADKLPSSDEDDNQLRKWRNRLIENERITFSLEAMKDAQYQIAIKNEFHSLIEERQAVKWDGKERIAELINAFKMKIIPWAKDLKRRPLVEIAMERWLIGSWRRVMVPGAKFEIVPCLLSEIQGLNKTTALYVLFGSQNVLDEDILSLPEQKQFEKTRNGIQCVELAETLGHETWTDVANIKAIISRRYYVGREVWGRNEGIKHVGLRHVYVHTGNNDELFRDPTGARRFIPAEITSMIDEDWLRRNRNQLWAEIAHKERVYRDKYHEDQLANGVEIVPGDEKFDDIFIPEEYWEEAAALQRMYRVGNSYEDTLSNLLYQGFVVVGDSSFIVRSDAIRVYLQYNQQQWRRESQAVSDVMKGLIVMNRDECEGLTRDIK